MEINIDTINYIAKLAKLKFSDEEAAKFAQEFKDILEHLKNIDDENLIAVETNISKNNKSVLRKDVVKIFEEKEELFKNTKDMKDGSIVIPKVIE